MTKRNYLVEISSSDRRRIHHQHLTYIVVCSTSYFNVYTNYFPTIRLKKCVFETTILHFSVNQMNLQTSTFVLAFLHPLRRLILTSPVAPSISCPCVFYANTSVRNGSNKKQRKVWIKPLTWTGPCLFNVEWCLIKTYFIFHHIIIHEIELGVISIMLFTICIAKRIFKVEEMIKNVSYSCFHVNNLLKKSHIILQCEKG